MPSISVRAKATLHDMASIRVARYVRKELFIHAPKALVYIFLITEELITEAIIEEKALQRPRHILTGQSDQAYHVVDRVEIPWQW